MLRVALVGYGAIGGGILAYCLERGQDVVAIVDKDQEKVGKSPRQISNANCDVHILSDVREVRMEGVDVAIFASRSRLADVVDDMEHVLLQGVDVVSTCEELAFVKPSEKAGARLEKAAAGGGVSVVGVGVNPGFVMDWIPSVVASASKNPRKIHVTRSLDVGRRRHQLQTKMGVGLNRSAFDDGVKRGSLGHVGLAESVGLIALSLGKEAPHVREGIEPIMGSEDYVMGARQFAESTAGGCTIRLDLEMSMTSSDFDLIEVEGDPNLKLRFENGVFGDSATVALTVSAAERIAFARPGLITVLELPLSGPSHGRKNG
ncbi:MAG TPA: hypothetical protein VEJ36_05600 [Nitrososphaerales archaeon]|nr:hypothetical protein [Nitrososphaerales archaeon]